MRTSYLRSLQGALLVVGVFSLTGAKDNGCLGSSSDGQSIDDGGNIAPAPYPQPEPYPCPEGHRWVDDEDCGPNEEPHCVPDDAVCPDNSRAVTVCDGGSPVQPASDVGEGCSFDDAGCSPPNPGGKCWTECQPIGNCPPGQHEETICPAIYCEPGSTEGICPVECTPQCVDDNWCGPGYHVEVVCKDPPPPAPPEVEPADGSSPANPTGGGQDPNSPTYDGGGCYETCVADQPQCGPGYHYEEVCEAAPCAEGQACDTSLKCSNTCVDDGEPVCEPGYHAEEHCWSPPCPEGQACAAVVECETTCVSDEKPTAGGGTTGSTGTK